MRMLPSCLLITLLVVEVEAKSLSIAMAKIKENAGFDPKEPPQHKTDIKVGLYLEHLLDVSVEKHTFDMDFYLTEEWKDGRNYSALFSDEDLVELEPDSCEEQRTSRSARELLSMKRSARDVEGPEQRARRLTEVAYEEDFNPRKGDVVKYFNEHAGLKGTTYTATIESLSTDENGKVIYNIVYTDESGFVNGMRRPTFLENLSSMPQPARRFVEFGHDELKLIWEPDVHITNLHQDMLVHEELLRVYEDGHVEFIRFVWAKLDMHEKPVIGHPVDTLMLEVHIASLSHSTKRITLHEHPTMNGLEESLVEKWSAGWNHVDHEFHVADKMPDYAHADPCRQELRSVYVFDLFVSRPSAKQLSTKLDQLSHKAESPPAHLTEVNVGVFFEQVRAVDDKLHQFTSIFYTIYRWRDERDYSILFNDPNFLETEATVCSEGQHNIRNLDDVANPIEEGSSAEHRVRRLSRRLAASSSGSSAKSGSSSSSGVTGSAKSSADSADGTTRRFVEFGHDERKLLWAPDLHVVNEKGEPQIHSELMRIYDDGWVEIIELQEGVLEMLHPDYISFPFDSQGLNVEIESESHSSKRIVLNSLEEMIGVEESLLGDWVAGWTYISEDHHVFLRSPDYTHGSACRGETLSRFDFHIVLEREGWKTVEQVLVPCTVLVLISFIAFFIDIKTLMPRIAVGFLTFLTMTNWEASTVETFASQEHPVWFIEFFKMMRLIVAMTLWQTCFSSYVGEKVSVRLSREIDKRARLVFFVDYVIAITTISLMPKNQGGVEALNFFGYINAFMIMLIIVAWGRVLHLRLRHALTFDPLAVFHETTEDMDTNELMDLYGILDKDGDEQVTVETIVRALMVDMHKNSGETNVAVKRKHEAELVALCKKKIAEDDAPPLLHRHAFESHYKGIFGEALAWKIRHDAMGKKGGGLLGRLSCSSLLGKKGRSGSSASSTDVELYEYKGQEGSFSKDPPSEPPSWRSSPDAVRIKKRPSRNAQILDSWNGLEVSATPELQNKFSGSSSANTDQDQV